MSRNIYHWKCSSVIFTQEHQKEVIQLVREKQKKVAINEIYFAQNNIFCVGEVL